MAVCGNRRRFSLVDVALNGNLVRSRRTTLKI